MRRTFAGAVEGSTQLIGPWHCSVSSTSIFSWELPSLSFSFSSPPGRCGKSSCLTAHFFFSATEGSWRTEVWHWVSSESKQCILSFKMWTLFKKKTFYMDYPKMDYPQKNLFQMSGMLRGCDYIRTQHGRWFSFHSAFNCNKVVGSSRCPIALSTFSFLLHFDVLEKKNQTTSCFCAQTSKKNHA